MPSAVWRCRDWIQTCTRGGRLPVCLLEGGLGSPQSVAEVEAYFSGSQSNVSSMNPMLSSVSSAAYGLWSNSTQEKRNKFDEDDDERFSTAGSNRRPNNFPLSNILFTRGSFDIGSRSYYFVDSIVMRIVTIIYNNHYDFYYFLYSDTKSTSWSSLLCILDISALPAKRASSDSFKVCGVTPYSRQSLQ